MSNVYRRAVGLRSATQRLAIAAIFLAALFAAAVPRSSAQATPKPTLPKELSNAEFWKLFTDLSEPGGEYMSENFTSDENGFPRILDALRGRVLPGGAYLGVGPEQNFHYIATLRPEIAFIIDIRRDNALQHLMYKAVFELSSDRADFLSLLFSKARPKGITERSTLDEIWDALWFVPTWDATVTRNFERIQDHLVQKRKFALSSRDLAALKRVYSAFADLGPNINWAGYGPIGPNTTRTTRSSDTTRRDPTFAELSLARDASGSGVSFLASEERFRIVKEMHSRNLIVPVVGDFGGPMAIRSVGSYLKARNATVAAFYLSNVEGYLSEAGLQSFLENVATLPLSASSTFMRTFFSSVVIDGVPYMKPNYRGTAPQAYFTYTSVCPMEPTVRALRAVGVPGHFDAWKCPPPRGLE